MIGLCLAAGLGTRLKEEAKDKPKCMVDVGNKPILERIADSLEKAGVDKIIVNLHSFPNVVMDYFGQRFLYLYEPVPMGEANTVAIIKRWFPDKKIMVVNGDTLVFGKNHNEKRHCGITYYYPDGEVDKMTGFDFIDIGTPEGLKKARERYV